MGNNHSYNYGILAHELLPKSRFLHSETDPRFGEVGIFQQNEEGETFRTNIFCKIIDSVPLHISLIDDLATGKISLSHPNILSLISPPQPFFPSPDQAERSFSLTLEHWHYDLTSMIREMLKQKKRFSEEQLTSWFLACLEALAYMQELGLPHGYIVPESILFVQGFVKLAPQSLIQGPFTLLMKVEAGEKTPFISPEDLQQHFQTVSIFKKNTYKSDCFGLGMVFLYASLLDRFHDCTNWSTKPPSFDQSKLATNLNELSRHYSGRLIDMITMAVNVDVASRHDPISLLNILRNTNGKGKDNTARPKLTITTTTPTKQKLLIFENSQNKGGTPNKTETVNGHQNSLKHTTPRKDVKAVPPSNQTCNNKRNNHLGTENIIPVSPLTKNPAYNPTTHGNVPMNPFFPPHQQGRSPLQRTRSAFNFGTPINNYNATPGTNQYMNQNQVPSSYLPNQVYHQADTNCTTRRVSGTPIHYQPLGHVYQTALPNNPTEQGLKTLLKLNAATPLTNSIYYESIPRAPLPPEQNNQTVCFTSKENMTQQPSKHDESVNLSTHLKQKFDGGNERSPLRRRQSELNMNNQTGHFTPGKKPHRMMDDILKVEKSRDLDETWADLQRTVCEIKTTTPKNSKFKLQGSYYEGMISNGVRNGHGKYIFRNGGYYEGEWRQNKIEGFGRLYYPNGELAYEGEWVDEKFNGRGRLHNDKPDRSVTVDFRDLTTLEEGWITYEGSFKQDNKDGYGAITYVDGSRFQGHFVDDVACGQGRFIPRHGKPIDGVWKENKLVRIQTFPIDRELFDVSCLG